MSYIIKMALDIKAGFEPQRHDIPLEAYCAVGTIAKAMKLGMPERKDTLFEMRDQLDGDMGGNEPEGQPDIARIHAILKDFIRNEGYHGPDDGICGIWI